MRKRRTAKTERIITSRKRKGISGKSEKQVLKNFVVRLSE